MVEQIGVEPCVTEDGMKKYVNDVLQKIKADKNKISMVNFFLFGRKNKKSRWKIDFYDSICFQLPKNSTDKDSEALKLAKSHSIVTGGGGLCYQW